MNWADQKINRTQKALTAKELKAIPMLYSQDSKGMDAIAYVHFFFGSYDLWATEYNPETGEFFGLVRMGSNEPELGYSSIQEIATVGRIERDLYWTPKPLRECIR